MKKSNPNISTYKSPSVSPRARLIEFAQDRARLLDSALDRARSYYAVEGIHQFRTETKQRRALIGVLKCADVAPAAVDDLIVPRQLYKSAGTLRDIDICQEIALALLSKFDTSGFLNCLKHAELKHRASFTLNSGGQSLPSALKVRHLIDRSLKGLSDTQIRALIVHRILRLANKLAKSGCHNNWNTSRLHQFRKSAKALRYTLDIWQVCFGEKVQIANFVRSLQRKTGLLGKWRDLTLTEEKLSAFLESAKLQSQIDLKHYSDFSAELRTRRKRYKSQFLSGLPILQRELSAIINGFLAGTRRSGDNEKHQHLRLQ
jgi:CHAD domain-containing protein